MAKTVIPEQVEVSGIKINKDLTNGPYFVDGEDTLAKLWKLRCDESKEKIAHREKNMVFGRHILGKTFIKILV